MSNEPTMKLVTNLDRAAIEAKLREVGGEAAAACGDGVGDGHRR